MKYSTKYSKKDSKKDQSTSSVAHVTSCVPSIFYFEATPSSLIAHTKHHDLDDPLAPMFFSTYTLLTTVSSYEYLKSFLPSICRLVLFLSERSLQLRPISDIPSKIYCHALALGVGFSHSKKTLL